MKEITKLMVNQYKILELQKDFCGYSIQKNQISYHHTIVPKRQGGRFTIENGSILNRDTSHPYIHTIEHYDLDRFREITKRLIEENRLGRLDLECIRRIWDVLSSFEKEYSGRTHKGKEIIKEEYTLRR